MTRTAVIALCAIGLLLSLPWILKAMPGLVERAAEERLVGTWSRVYISPRGRPRYIRETYGEGGTWKQTVEGPGIDAPIADDGTFSLEGDTIRIRARHAGEKSMEIVEWVGTDKMLIHENVMDYELSRE